MEKVSKEQYEFALIRIEELLPLVNDNTPANDKNAVELSVICFSFETFLTTSVDEAATFLSIFANAFVKTSFALSAGLSPI